MRLIALFLCFGVSFASIFPWTRRPTEESTPDFSMNTPPNTPSPMDCIWEGKLYHDGQEVYKHQDGDCISGAYCSSGSITHWDGFFCFHSTSTTEEPTTTIPSGFDLTNACQGPMRMYSNYETIRSYVPWPGCHIVDECHYGTIRTRQSPGCRTTIPPYVSTIPPWVTTIPPWVHQTTKRPTGRPH